MVRASGFVKRLEKWNIIERKSSWSLTCFKPSHCELVWVLIVSSSSNPTKPFSRRSTIRCSYCKRPKPGKSRWCIAQSSWTCFPSWISVAAALRTWGVRRFNARDLPLVPVSSLLPTPERTYFRVHPSSHLCQKTPRDSLVVDRRPAEAHRKEEIHNSSWLPYCNVSIVFGCLCYLYRWNVVSYKYAAGYLDEILGVRPTCSFILICSNVSCNIFLCYAWRMINPVHKPR